VRDGSLLWLLRPRACTALPPLTVCCENSEEEASIASAKPKAPKAGASKAAAKKPAALAASKDASPKTSAPGTPRRGEVPDFDDAMNAPLESFSASNIDDALALLSLVGEKNDKASVGSRAAQTLDAHPERRYKAALAAYKEHELPTVRKENPGLRLQQCEELIYKAFKKSPENPFNQATVAFDATKEEKVEALKALRAQTEQRLKDRE